MKRQGGKTYGRLRGEGDEEAREREWEMKRQGRESGR